MLIGTSVYQLLEFKLADIDWFLDGIYNVGGNCTEIFASYTWSRGVNWQPYLNFGTAAEPIYHYGRENPSYWEKLEYIMAGCAKRDLTLILRILDYCSVANEKYYELLAWHHSVQKTYWQDVLHRPWGGFYGDGPKPYYSAYMKHIIDLAKQTKCKVIYHAVNEAGYKPSKKELAGWLLKGKNPTKMKDAIILKFHQWLLRELDKYGKMLHCISTNLDYIKNREWAAGAGVWFEVHGCDSPQALVDVHELGAGYVPNGDGPDPDARGRQGDKPEKREPSVDQAKVMGEQIKKWGVPYYCYFNRNTENPLPADLRRAKFDVLEAIVKAAI